jgi:hypothetical protein
LCYGAEDRDTRLYAVNGQPRTVEQVMDSMQYFQHSRQTKSSKPRREVRKEGPDGGHSDEEWKELKKRVGDLQKGMSELVKGLRDRTPSPRRQPQSGDKKPAGCFKCGDPGHFKRECPLLQGNQETDKGQGKPAKPTDQDGKRGNGGRIRLPQGGDGIRHKEVRVVTPDRLPDRSFVRTPQGRGRSTSSR